MYGNFLLILSLFLLAACNPNKPTSESAKNSKTISIEQQKHDALVILEAENALLVSAQAESNHAASLLLQSTELELQHNEQLLSQIALGEKEQEEQNLAESAKLESEKIKALLDQAAR